MQDKGLLTRHLALARLRPPSIVQQSIESCERAERALLTSRNSGYRLPKGVKYIENSMGLGCWAGYQWTTEQARPVSR